MLVSALVIGAGFTASSDISTSVAASNRYRPVAGSAGRLSSKAALGCVYVVEPGECLERIARRNGLSTVVLAKANGIPADGQLRAGQYLHIPPAPKYAADHAPVRQTYTIKHGDSLWLIAKRFGTTPHTIAALNGIRVTATLHAGKQLRLPGQAKPKTQTAAAKPNDGLVETALGYRGVRYRYGGITTRGLDCSGLVFRVLQNHGIKAPHNSRALYKLGKAIARGNLRSGDLVFFHTRGRGISHVGMYIGNGKFVHASSSKGRVRVDRLDDGYYARRYVGARRVS